MADQNDSRRYAQFLSHAARTAALLLNRESSVELVLPIRAHCRRVRTHFGAEVAEGDEWFGLAGVLEGHVVQPATASPIRLAVIL